MKRILCGLAACALLISCGGGGTGTGANNTPSAEQTCATVANNFGNAFYCGTNRSAPGVITFPDGAVGYCQTAVENLGNVGYSAVMTVSGITGFGNVRSQGNASTECSNWQGSCQSCTCNSYIRCTRV